MNEQELRETLALLRNAGVNALLCDKPVSLSGCSVVCGIPTEPGDIDLSEWVLLPKELVGRYPEIMVPADGESMLDAGYEPGDRLRIRLGVSAHDSDDVMAWIDGRCTVKSLMTDEDGVRWLVPQNDDYDAIELTDDMDWRVLGVVVGVEKASTRASSRVLLQSIRRTKNKKRAARKLSDDEVDERIMKIGEMVKHARQWYAVYKAMNDKKLIGEGEYLAFCERVKRLLPEHKHLPDPKEISRMAVQSFAKEIAFWVESNAPVRGMRFKDYLNIGMTMGNLLSV